MTSLTPWSTMRMVQPITSMPSMSPSASVSATSGSVERPSTKPSLSLSLALYSSRLVKRSFSSTTTARSCRRLMTSWSISTLME